MLKPLTNPNFVKSFIQCRNSVTQNINTANWVNVKITGTQDINIGDDFVVQSRAIKCLFDGFIDIYGSIRGTSTIQRASPEIRITKNNIPIGPIGSSGYLRSASGHNISSSSIRSLVSCKKNDLIKIQCHREAKAGTVTMVSGTSVLLINRIK